MEPRAAAPELASWRFISSGRRCTAEVRFKLSQGGSFTPWVALGLGYESVTLTASEGSRAISADATGWELVNLQIGGEFLNESSRFSLGPFLSFSLDRTTTISAGVE